MLLKVFAVYDLKACAFFQPFFSGQSGSAIRGFGDSVNDGKSPFGAHPEDYQLFELGTFDDNVGTLTGLLPMKLLCSASDFSASKVSIKGDIMQEVTTNGSEKA